MTKTVKTAIETLKHFSPYTDAKLDCDETYNELYNALYKLACYGIITKEEWNKIVETDRKLYEMS